MNGHAAIPDWPSVHWPGIGTAHGRLRPVAHAVYRIIVGFVVVANFVLDIGWCSGHRDQARQYPAGRS
jgi:hypothetical protein